MPSKKSTCANCCRPDMTIVGHGLCGTCYAVRVGRTGEALDKALAAAKIKLWAAYQDGLNKTAKGPASDKHSPITEGNVPLENGPAAATEAAADEATASFARPSLYVGPSMTGGFGLHEVIPVDFGHEDRDLFDYVCGQAKKYRRTPDQQILYWIDCNRQADLEQAKW